MALFVLRAVSGSTLREQPRTMAVKTLAAAPSTSELGIFVLRIGLGIVFTMHGWQKLFQMGVPGVASFFGMIGVPAPEIAAAVVTILELTGGIMLLLGLFVRWIAIPLALDMLTAALVVHLPGGFFAPDGVEMVLLPLAGSVALILAGPGRFALDQIVLSPRSQTAPLVANTR